MRLQCHAGAPPPRDGQQLRTGTVHIEPDRFRSHRNWFLAGGQEFLRGSIPGHQIEGLADRGAGPANAGVGRTEALGMLLRKKEGRKVMTCGTRASVRRRAKETSRPQPCPAYKILFPWVRSFGKMLQNQRGANEVGDDISYEFAGEKMMITTSGTAIGRWSKGTVFVTSASLFIAVRAARNHDMCVKIKVHHGIYVSEGFLEEYDLVDHGIAFVVVRHGYPFYCVPLNPGVEEIPHRGRVIAVGCDIDGTLRTTCGTCTDSRGSEDSEYLMFSTCKLAKEGSALFDLSGIFVGMNLFSYMERSIFVPRRIIIDCLVHLKTYKQKKAFLGLMKPFRDIERCIGPRLLINFAALRVSICGIKVNTSKVYFGDEYPSGVWGEFKEGVALNILKNVVALASFTGESKLFECTGFFIDNVDDKCPTILTSASLVRFSDGTDEIVEDLRIEVWLPNNQSIEGKLEHYSLHYNVALVSVKNYNVDCPASLKHDKIDYSTKVGIGGPLVDVNGNFVGMNYYNPKMGTPFLRCDYLCGILNYFKTKETKFLDIIIGGEQDIVRDGEGPQYSWILDEPVYMTAEEIENEQAALEDSRFYGYINGAFAVRK
ncbi:hypothetical protein HU200_060428 [Digitaria exilis]|uniref:Uncharacterized protein n=1 Tax=Digitaria exilis TaxID=1010633 RepID=A0A835E1P5_9POAL|nr:hypothetical protein HU200_060428 [Digitaria exilis]